jgi:crossover junction endodeoxyribonuclease RuvC
LIILGIDPGLADTGWGLVSFVDGRLACRGYGCVSSGADEPLPARLQRIHRQLAGLVDEHGPAEAAIEKLFHGVNARSALATGQARGVALLATADAGIPVDEYSPAEIKQAVVGNGAADKAQVQFMVRAILRLDEIPRPDHAADALAVAICHANLRGRRRAVDAAGARARDGFAAAVAAAQAREARR